MPIGKRKRRVTWAGCVALSLKGKAMAICLHGYNEKIELTISEAPGFPDSTSYEGGYDLICELVIEIGCFHIRHDRLFSATGALYRFADELRNCYDTLSGTAEYKLLLENDLSFQVVMGSGGHAVVTGSFRERPDKNNIFEFEMETDQSCFLPVLQEIEALKKVYGGMTGRRTGCGGDDGKPDR